MKCLRCLLWIVSLFAVSSFASVAPVLAQAEKQGPAAGGKVQGPSSRVANGSIKDGGDTTSYEFTTSTSSSEESEVRLLQRVEPCVACDFDGPVLGFVDGVPYYRETVATRNFDETSTSQQVSQTTTTSQTTIGGFVFGTHTTIITNTNTHTLTTHVTEETTTYCVKPPDCPSRCEARLSQWSASFSAAGGGGVFDLLAKDDCRWSASTIADWIKLKSPTEGQGKAEFSFAVAPNPDHRFRSALINVIVEGVTLSFFIDQTGHPLAVSINDPAACLGDGRTVGVTAWVSNLGAGELEATFTAALPAELRGIAGSCTTTKGTCLVDRSTVVWQGVLAPGQTIPISYQALIAAGTPNGTMLGIGNSVAFTAGDVVSLDYRFPLSCPTPATEAVFCRTSSFAVPRFTRRISRPDDLALLSQPLTLTIASPQPGSDSFAVNQQSFGSLDGFPDASTQGLKLGTTGAVTRALSCLDSFERVSFAVAGTGAAGDVVRLFLQDEQGARVRELARLTVGADGRSLMIEQLHPDASLLIDEGAGMGLGSVISLAQEAGASGHRTGMMTLVFGGALAECSQLGIELSRGAGPGSISFVLAEAIVNRLAQDGDTGDVPSGQPCRVACPPCPPQTKALECITTCFSSPETYLRRLALPGAALPEGTISCSGRPVSTGNTLLIGQCLSQGPEPGRRFDRQYAATQLSLLRAGAIHRIGVRRSTLACYGLDFAPVTLESGVTLAPSSTLEELLFEAHRLSTSESADRRALAEILTLLNRCDGVR